MKFLDNFSEEVIILLICQSKVAYLIGRIFQHKLESVNVIHASHNIPILHILFIACFLLSKEMVYWKTLMFLISVICVRYQLLFLVAVVGDQHIRLRKGVRACPTEAAAAFLGAGCSPPASRRSNASISSIASLALSVSLNW